MTLLATLRQLRHGPLRCFGPLWTALGRAYRAVLALLPIEAAASQRIGPYGPFKLHADYAFSDFAGWGGGHNRCFQACIEAARDKSCVLDIGAHIGLVTLPMSAVLARGGRLYAFEPARANHRFLRRHLELNGIDNVEIVESLVGAEDLEAVRFFEQPQATGMNSVIVVKDHDAYRETRRRQVTLDSFCQAHGLDPEVIKIDVEGAELDVLAGGSEVLRRCRPTIFLSIHPQHIAELGRSCEELTDLIEALGYDCQDLDGRSVTRFLRDEYTLIPRDPHAH